MIHFDSSFVIDLHREIAKERPGGAFAFIESLGATEILGVSVHVVCEFARELSSLGTPCVSMN